MGGTVAVAAAVVVVVSTGARVGDRCIRGGTGGAAASTSCACSNSANTQPADQTSSDISNPPPAPASLPSATAPELWASLGQPPLPSTK
eukprot:CAMPEP_0171965154 /NCGR_PEP_ID=MMETSP0993-20121228/185644_1 /TAXON_ID=483369 /ORGANISM="non described non described, Strain CCMP2098" /LENGTH=88 /DNA_ID=CAMNT_0012614147 /DNA_START=79 /DNA_END=345 /DNA_ORIENTATION=-